MGLAKYQRKGLEHSKEITSRIFDKVWGLLPPSPERGAIMHHLHAAKVAMNHMLEESEQMTMEEILDEDN